MTVEQYRGKNLAQKLAHTYGRNCFTNLFVPYLDCREENHPSVAIAEYLGCTTVFAYNSYMLPIHKKSNAIRRCSFCMFIYSIAYHL
ncbi:GNAT family N-acetyltransferase [Halobacillus salinus]|uniref:GNAT family N-acetyltransferase n=1 Tax=Halobacillus salinus TaxID=192814 RepID=UPI00349F3526